MVIDWRDIVTVSSLVIALDQYRRLLNERAARRVARIGLMMKVAAHAFAEMARLCSDLSSWIKIQDWDRTVDVVNRLRISLAEANAASPEVLTSYELDRCRVVINDLAAIQNALPVEENRAVAPENVQEMINQCVSESTYLAEIVGRLKYREQEES